MIIASISIQGRKNTYAYGFGATVVPLLCVVVHGSVVQDVPFSLSSCATMLFLLFAVMVVPASDVSPSGSFFYSSGLWDGELSLSICVSATVSGGRT